MRDPREYERHGRNNPLAPEQLREHPYDFVSLPDRPAAGHAVGHDRYLPDRLTGTLRLVYTTTMPLHVGSGSFDTAAECGLEGGDTPVRGIARSRGRSVLPGSSWKGVVRARFEAITRSRLTLADHGSREPAFKVPEALRDPSSSPKSYRVSVEDRRVDELRSPRNVNHEEDLGKLSPADALFGAMGYRGRVHPNDGTIEGPAATTPLQVTPLDSPVMHRLARPGKTQRAGRGGITISEVEGRKFYYDGPIVEARRGDDHGGARYELIDHVPAGATITLDVHLESLTLAELGALLVSAGFGDDAGIVRFGGYKPAGLGKVEVKSVAIEARLGSSTRSWRRDEARSIEPGEAVAEARNQGLVDAAALEELDRITRRRRPE